MSDSHSSVFFVGTYMLPGPYFEANGAGLISCSLNQSSGQIEKLCVCQDAGNATYLAKQAGSDILFVASDRYFDQGQLHSFLVGHSGQLRQLSTESTQGQATCHVSIDTDAEHAFVASYHDGKLTVHPVLDSSVQPAMRVIVYEGKSVNQDRQESAHAHQSVVSPDGRCLYVCDLGSDKVWVHELAHLEDPSRPIASIDMPAGSGPRHLVCHPRLNRLYVFCELTACVLVVDFDDRGLNYQVVEELDSLPSNFKGVPAGAAIKLHLSGKSLYVSNRNHNSVSVFSIDESTGDLELAANFSTQGEEPRDIEFDTTGTWLLVANQNSNTVIPFGVDSATGLPTGRSAPAFPCGSPVCILFS